MNFLISDILQCYKENGIIDEVASFSNIFQDSQVVIGRLSYDSFDKQLFLEEENTGVVLPVSLNFLNEYFFFPGQVVAMECTFSGGHLNALKVFDPVFPSKPKEPELKDLSIVVACGPYTTQDSVQYEPLNDLITQLHLNPPDLCILMGPFIDCQYVEQQIVEDLETLQQNLLNKLKDMAANLNFHLVIVPSQRDFLHEFVYPQPPFRLSSNSFVTYLPDPCTIEINGLIIGMTSTDVLMHISKEAISKSQGSVDRFSKLIQCLLGQQNYYPLYPPSPELNLDLDLFELHGKMPSTPHLLILPSDLKCFTKVINSCTCVNPGKLSKKEAGGTYARINVRSRLSEINKEGNEPKMVCEDGDHDIDGRLKIIEDEVGDSARSAVACDVKVVRV